MSEESIYDLFKKVRNHPDFEFGTIFTKDDLVGYEKGKNYNPRRFDEWMCEAGCDAINESCELLEEDNE